MMEWLNPQVIMTSCLTHCIARQSVRASSGLSPNLNTPTLTARMYQTHTGSIPFPDSPKSPETQ
ncbi:hypothetical protein SAMN04488238_101273 [Roseicitreum antarcticum]|uniref:Uncharacterized protein n=1 Tax=Roseicitreum antarcticum TaxID=564137 RepID=A0A1H2RDF5_9RHOB|nr:hypothetical protein SAMN04488238_101273 [Roseicitreum antarcticum]